MTEAEFRAMLAQNLAKYRKLNGLTQIELAECIGYSDKSVSKWERGEGAPDAYVLLRLARLYGISVSELMGETGESKETAALIRAMEKNEKAREKARKRVTERAARERRRDRKKEPRRE